MKRINLMYSDQIVLNMYRNRVVDKIRYGGTITIYTIHLKRYTRIYNDNVHKRMYANGETIIKDELGVRGYI